MFRFTKFLLFSLFLIGLLCPAAHALQELGLVAEVQLPGSGPWDLQHWLDDSTYGWVYTGQNSFVCQLSQTEPVLTIQLSDSVRYLTPDRYSGITYVYSVMAGRLGSSGEIPAILCRAGASDFHSSASDDAFAVSIPDGYLTRRHVTYNSHDVVFCNYVRQGSASQFIWPPPPAISELAIRTHGARRACDGTGSDNTTDYGVGMAIALSGNTPIAFTDISFVSPFANAGPLTAVGLRVRISHTTHMQGGNPWEHWTWSLGHTHISQSSVPILTLCEGDLECDEGCDGSPVCQVSINPVAQCDSSGIQRFLISGGTCLSFPELDTLWINDEIVSSTHSGRLVGSSDERFISFNWNCNCFLVYDASNGSLIDTLSTMAGRLAYLLKPSSGPSELVTYDQFTYTVRVYKPIQRVTDLTIRYDANIERIMLDWSTVPNARSYKIYSANGYGEPESLLGTVYGGTLFGIPLDPSIRTKTLYVTANF